VGNKKLFVAPPSTHIPGARTSFPWATRLPLAS